MEQNQMKLHFAIIAAALMASTPCYAAPQTSSIAAIAATPETYLSEFVLNAQKVWPRNRPLRIVCHGHSVPAGYFKTPRLHITEAYPHRLHALLCERFPHASLGVVVTAIGGENAVSGAERFERDVLALRPDIVMIDYALNDRGLGLEKAREAWGTMIQLAQQQHAKIILLTPTPDQRSDLTNPEDPLHDHAKQIRSLAAEFGVGLVDSFALFQTAVAAGTPLPQLMSQVNHPNAAGHELITRDLLTWFPLPPPAESPK